MPPTFKLVSAVPVVATPPFGLFGHNDVRIVYRKSLGEYEYHPKFWWSPKGLQPLPLPDTHASKLSDDILEHAGNAGEIVLYDIELHVSYTSTPSPWSGKNAIIDRERSLITSLARYHADVQSRMGFTPEDVPGCDMWAPQWYYPNGVPARVVESDRRLMPLIRSRPAYGPLMNYTISPEQEKQLARAIHDHNSTIGLNHGVVCWLDLKTEEAQAEFFACMARIKREVERMEAESIPTDQVDAT